MLQTQFPEPFEIKNKALVIQRGNPEDEVNGKPRESGCLRPDDCFLGLPAVMYPVKVTQILVPEGLNSDTEPVNRR